MGPLRFTREHEWIRIDGEIGTVGITDYAQQQLGDIVFVELPTTGTSVAKGTQAAVVEIGEGGERGLRPRLGRSRRRQRRARR